MEILLKEELNLFNIKKYLKQYDMEKLGFDVDVEKENKLVKVFIKKMGISSIVLEERKENGSYIYKVVNEDIAFIHKPFRKLIDSNLVSVIEKLGGKIL